MAPFIKLRRTVYLGLLASMFVGSPAYAEISLPSAIELEQSIYFQNPSGEPVQFQAGLYDVQQKGENALNMIPIGTKAGEAMSIQALPAGHDEDIEANTANLVPPPDHNTDKQHLVFMTPDGLALESIGSYSGVFSRSPATWEQNVSADGAEQEAPLTVRFEKATYFKTIGGAPKSIQPGEYEVALTDDGLILTPSGDTEGEAMTVESEALGTSTATIIPEFGDNPDLELLMIATAGGQSIAAVGSHTGTFPRGFGSLLKRVGGKVKKSAQGAVNTARKHVVQKVKKGVQIAHGHAKKGVKKAVMAAKKHGAEAMQKVKSHGVKYAKKYGKKIKDGALTHGKKFISKVCGQGKSGKCIEVIAQQGGKLLQGAGG
ncbi:MAG: hypothetical protein MRJ96_08795 [Nitrospirales bacterium]|nr:hypothetical protein [Nitrospira sp.]MDR4501531.1 hypothetical protein [Nitrospirales bacterium]